ncbi:MAG: T9SS type A sorting domain-containing protein [Crocinitomix sp.]|nr:T9SS type A sorting domain-containing protein [Crocinitomix sp.]
MKNIITLLISFLLTNIAFSQDVTYTYSSEEENASIIIRDLNVTSDGSIIYGYDYMQTGAAPIAGIMKTDDNGDLIWSKTLTVDGSAEDCTFDFIENSDGNYYHWGLSKKIETDHMRALLSEITPDGEILWSKEYNFGINPLEWYTINKIEILPSGDLSMMIAISNKVIAMKTDPLGNIIWGTYTAVGPPDEGGKNPGFELLPMPDGGCMVSSKIDNYLSIVRIDGDGEFMWSKSHNIAATTETPYTHGKTIFRTPTGEIYLAGFLRGEDGNLNPFMSEISEETGEIVWMRTINDKILGFTGSAEFMLDGEDVILDMTMVDQHHYILKIGEFGLILSAIKSVNKVYPYDYNKLHIAPENYYMFGSIATDDGEFEGGFHRTDELFSSSCMYETTTLHTSSYFDYVDYEFEPFMATFSDVTAIEITASDQPLIKTVLCEEIDNSSVTEIDDKLALQVYPNPANDHITVIVSDELINAAYSITDLSGKIILTDKMNATQIKLDLSTLEKGQYILAVYGENKFYTKKITVMQ